jgi:succinate dehydrogenase / fumarate reductase membrane anchor subunit
MENFQQFTVKKSTKHGANHWIAHRVTAIANVFFTLWFAVSIIMIANGSIESARAWLATPINAIVMILMLINIFYHATLGIRVVIEDYVHCKCMKIGLLLATFFASFGAATIAVVSVLKILFTTL